MNIVGMNFGSVDVGNNFTQSHLVDAIKESDYAMEKIEILMHVELPATLHMKAQGNYGIIKDEIDLEDFLNFFK